MEVDNTRIPRPIVITGDALYEYICLFFVGAEEELKSSVLTCYTDDVVVASPNFSTRLIPKEEF